MNGIQEVRGSTPLISTKERVLEHADLCLGVSVRVSYEAAGSIELARYKNKKPALRRTSGERVFLCCY